MTHKHLLTDGNINTMKLVKATNYDVNFDYENRTTYDSFYEYLEENQHMYEWWML